MLSSLKLFFAGFFVLFACASFAQNKSRILSGEIMEPVNAELWITRIEDGKIVRMGEFQFSPANTSFLFPLSDSTKELRLQLNIKTPGKKTINKVFVKTLKFDARADYSLKIMPSKSDSTSLNGWSLGKMLKRPTVAWVSGKFIGVYGKFIPTVSLSSVKDGNLVTESNLVVQKDGRFVIPVKVRKEGFYYLSSIRWSNRIYLKPMDNVDVEVDNMSGFMKINKGSKENELLGNWQKLISPITNFGYNLIVPGKDSTNFVQFLTDYTNMEPAIDSFISAVPKYPDSRKNLINAFKLDREMVPLVYLERQSYKKVNGFRVASKEFEQVPGFYRQFISTHKFSDASIINLAESRNYMSLYAKLEVALLPAEKRASLSAADRMAFMMNCISNDTLKSYFLKDQLESQAVNNLSEFREIFEPYRQYSNHAVVSSKYKTVYNSFIGDTAYIGKSSYNFSLPDSTGKVVSMKDFQGKVVFIDVWATWCGPCKAQFPFLREIEEEYSKNDQIVFVGISIDKVEVKQKWQDMIVKEHLGGIQLLDDMGKGFAKKYGIKAVPRFLLIDKKGNWMEIRCPNPDAKKDLKRYLDKALAQP